MSSIFITGSDITKAQVSAIVKACTDLFDKVYLLGGEPLTSNHLNDPDGVYTIEKISNSVKYYSLYLNINGPEDFEQSDVHVDYLNYKVDKYFKVKQLKDVIQYKLDIFFPKNCPISRTEAKSVAVLDLDDTLINSTGEIIINNLHQYLERLRQHFTYIVLWSHGCQRHVNHIFQNNMAPYVQYFNLIITRNSVCQKSKKGIGYILKQLNLKFQTTSLSTTLLIDDQFCNYNSDYDYFIHTPHITKNFSCIMYTLLEKVISEISAKSACKNKLSLF